MTIVQYQVKLDQPITARLLFETANKITVFVKLQNVQCSIKYLLLNKLFKVFSNDVLHDLCLNKCSAILFI